MSCKSLKIGNGITQIMSGQFSSKVLKTITIGNSVTSIGIAAFSDNTLLESVNFVENSSLTTIYTAAFNNCTNPNLTISIPNSVTTINMFAFYNVNNINISETQEALSNYPWGALQVNGATP